MLSQGGAGVVSVLVVAVTVQILFSGIAALCAKITAFENWGLKKKKKQEISRKYEQAIHSKVQNKQCDNQKKEVLWDLTGTPRCSGCARYPQYNSHRRGNCSTYISNRME